MNSCALPSACLLLTALLCSPSFIEAQSSFSLEEAPYLQDAAVEDLLQVMDPHPDLLPQQLNLNSASLAGPLSAFLVIQPQKFAALHAQLARLRIWPLLLASAAAYALYSYRQLSTSTLLSIGENWNIDSEFQPSPKKKAHKPTKGFAHQPEGPQAVFPLIEDEWHEKEEDFFSPILQSQRDTQEKENDFPISKQDLATHYDAYLDHVHELMERYVLSISQIEDPRLRHQAERRRDQLYSLTSRMLGAIGQNIKSLSSESFDLGEAQLNALLTGPRVVVKNLEVALRDKEHRYPILSSGHIVLGLGMYPSLQSSQDPLYLHPLAQHHINSIFTDSLKEILTRKQQYSHREATDDAPSSLNKNVLNKKTATLMTNISREMRRLKPVHTFEDYRRKALTPPYYQPFVEQYLKVLRERHEDLETLMSEHQITADLHIADLHVRVQLLQQALTGFQKAIQTILNLRSIIAETQAIIRADPSQL